MANRPVFEQGLPPEWHERLVGAGEVIGHIMIIPHGPDRHGRQKSLDSRRSMLIAMFCSVLAQRGCREFTPRRIRRRRTSVIAIDQITEQNHKVRLLISKPLKDG